MIGTYSIYFRSRGYHTNLYTVHKNNLGVYLLISLFISVTIRLFIDNVKILNKSLANVGGSGQSPIIYFIVGHPLSPLEVDGICCFLCSN